MSGYKIVYRAHIKTQFNPENFYFMAVRVLVADWYDIKANLLEIPWHTSLLLKVSSWQPTFLALFILVDNLIGFPVPHFRWHRANFLVSGSGKLFGRVRVYDCLK